MYTYILARYGKGTVCMKITKTMHNDMIKCTVKYIEGEWITIAFIHTCCYLQWKKCYELLPATNSLKFRHTKPIHV